MIWLFLGYMWLSVHRAYEIWPVLGTLHIDWLNPPIMLFWAEGAETP